MSFNFQLPDGPQAVPKLRQLLVDFQNLSVAQSADMFNTVMIKEPIRPKRVVMHHLGRHTNVSYSNV